MLATSSERCDRPARARVGLFLQQTPANDLWQVRFYLEEEELNKTRLLSSKHSVFFGGGSLPGTQRRPPPDWSGAVRVE